MAGVLSSLASRFENAAFNVDLGVCVESLAEDRVRLRVPFKDEISNPGRALHGGVAASLIDIGGSLAAWTAFADRPNLEAGTLDLNVNYLAAAIGEDVIATAEVLRRGKELTYSSVDVRNDAGKRIAAGLVTYRIFDRDAVPQAAERQCNATPQAPPAALQRVRGANMFVGLGFIARLGIAVSHAHGGEAVLTMPWRNESADHGGTLHEGALAALIDTTGALASWSITGLNMAYKASTVGIHVSYHAAAAGEEVVAHARTLRRNNEIFLNQVEVSGRQSQRVLATGAVTYRIVVTE